MIALWLFVGGAVGVLNMLTLWHSVIRLRRGSPRRTVAWMLVGGLLRWGLTVGLLVAALQCGIVPCLLAFIGLWLVRWCIPAAVLRSQECG
ncbi:MAG TPA: hypothetical protein G4N97_01680 [Thermoflexia bacterium]|nr:hypothetical protein [Thermoflexia bacterium]